MTAIEIASKIVKEFEGCALQAYKDLGGIWTIGYGCTHSVCKGMEITQENAEDRLEKDLLDTYERVQAQITQPINVNQAAALLSFTFNEGAGHLRESTLESKLNAGDYAGAADQFLLWNKCRGIMVPGLLRRRQAERDLFLTAV